MITDKARKRIFNACTLAALAGWFGYIYMRFTYYLPVAPTEYNATTGHIYSVNKHGYVFFLDKTQNYLSLSPLVPTAGFIIIALLLESRWKIFRKGIEEAKIRKYMPRNR